MSIWKKRISEALKKKQKVAVVIGVSAGKDSTATVLLFQKTFPKLKAHFVFADTGAELKETYEYLDLLEEKLNIKIARIKSKLGTLEEYIEKSGGYLPSPVARYCTRLMKIAPFRDYMDELCKTHDVVFNLVGIRADEGTRVGYTPCGQYAHKVFTLMPLKDEGLVLADVFKIVEKSVGLPKYYEWRTRSGCYFCFYQRRIEWVGLMERHPDLFEKAKSFEKDGFSWIKDLPLAELAKKAEKIKERYKKKLAKKLKKGETLSLTDAQLFEELMRELEPEESKESCSVCR